MGQRSVLEARAIRAVMVRPRLWRTALRQVARLARDRWWARPPFLPLPSSSYVRFRLETQYGDTTHRPEPDDLVRFLQWCRTWDAGEWAGRTKSGSRSDRAA